MIGENSKRINEGTNELFRKNSNFLWDGIYKRIDQLKSGQAFDVDLGSVEDAVKLRQSIYQRYRYHTVSKGKVPEALKDVTVFRNGARLTVARPHVD